MQKIKNFRDIGGSITEDGRKVRTGLLFRSANPDSVSKEDIRELQEIGIKTIIDLRPSNELRKSKIMPPSIRRITIPFDITAKTRKRMKPIMKKKDARQEIIDTMGTIYSDLVDSHKEAVRDVFNILSDEKNYPILYHCHWGKDRTGFITALLSLLFGVEKETIIADYLRTNDHMLKDAFRVLGLMGILSLGFFPAGNYKIAARSYEQHINLVLNKITNEYHGIIEYLKICRVSETDLFLFKEKMLV